MLPIRKIVFFPLTATVDPFLPTPPVNTTTKALYAQIPPQIIVLKGIKCHRKKF